MTSKGPRCRSTSAAPGRCVTSFGGFDVGTASCVFGRPVAKGRISVEINVDDPIDGGRSNEFDNRFDDDIRIDTRLQPRRHIQIPRSP